MKQLKIVLQPVQVQVLKLLCHSSTSLCHDGGNSATCDISLGNHKLTIIDDPSVNRYIADKKFVTNAPYVRL
jgi:hypothetical protein